MPVCAAKRRTWRRDRAVAGRGRRARSGRSWRASCSSSFIAWFTSRFSSPSSSASSGGAECESASSRSRIAVSAWFTSSWRSRASRRRSSSWARSTSRPLRRRSSSIRDEHAAERAASRPTSSASCGSVGSVELAGRGGSIASIVARSAARAAMKRRRSIIMFTSRTRMIVSASSANERRSSWSFRLRFAAALAANSVATTSRTLTATTWPASEEVCVRGFMRASTGQMGS